MVFKSRRVNQRWRLGKMMNSNAKYNSLTIREPTPEGTAYITIVENTPGKVIRIFTHIGKSGTALNSYTFAIDELVTALFEKGSTITEVISYLSDISSDRSARFANESGSYNRSYAEALARALKMYLSSLDTLPDGEKKVAKLSNA